MTKQSDVSIALALSGALADEDGLDGILARISGDVYGLALRQGVTPRTIVELVFEGCPDDDEWRAEIEPVLRALATRLARTKEIE